MQCILNHKQIEQKIVRLGHQLIENCYKEDKVYLGGISGNGSILAEKLKVIIENNSNLEVIIFDLIINKDFPWENDVRLSIDEKLLKDSFVILVDDVINSGKTMQYALVKLLQYPTKAIKTVVLFDRQHRRFPVKASFVGLSLSTTLKDRVEVEFHSSDSKAYLK